MSEEKTEYEVVEAKKETKTSKKKTLDNKDDLEDFATQVSRALSDKQSVDPSDIKGFADEAMEEGMLFTGALITGFLNSSDDIQSEILANALNAKKPSSKSGSVLSSNAPDGVVGMLDNIINSLVDDPDLLDHIGMDVPDHIKELLHELADKKRKFNSTGSLSDEDIKEAKAMLRKAIGAEEGEDGDSEFNEDEEFEKYKSLTAFDAEKYNL